MGDFMHAWIVCMVCGTFYGINKITYKGPARIICEECKNKKETAIVKK